MDNSYTLFPYKNSFIYLDQLVEGRIFYKNHSVDLLTNVVSTVGLKEWLLDSLETTETFYTMPIVNHYFYEAGLVINDLADMVPDDAILLIQLCFKRFKKVKLRPPSKKIKLKSEICPNLDSYANNFSKGYDELLKGNSYQFNLTDKFVFKFDKSLTPEDFISSLWREGKNIGAYGVATYIEKFKKLYLSNSPECLFQLEEGKTLLTRPIKGTTTLTAHDDLDLKWNELINDVKSRAELDMITDLMRNDLSRIDLPNSVVTKRSEKLIVPGLLHQYSEIKVQLSKKISIGHLLFCLFPGGSITGAPKVNTMKILNQLEKRERGFYTGSTAIFYRDFKAASINIRSSEIDFIHLKLEYQAGGGITLKSNHEDEFKEMSYKLQSFLSALTL